jgi:hypothetical protein
MSDEIDIETIHEKLFSGASLKIGKIQWYISKADFEMEKLCFTEGNHGQSVVTAFGQEVNDEIQWWIFKKETDITGLMDRTRIVLKSVQKLKEASLSLKEKFVARSYEELISKIKDFTESYAKEIDDLLDYIVWLNKKDVLAPSILYTYRVWGSTRLSDRYIPIMVSTIDDERPEVIRRTTEIALGLFLRDRYTIFSEYMDFAYDIYSSDPENSYWPPISEEHITTATSHKVLDELAIYFEFLRNSLRNILLELERFKAQAELLTDESFWKSFIIKAMDKEIENVLWDFKNTLDMWHSRPEEKEKTAIKFCEQVAAFANNKGGAMIIGITNTPPRTIVGVDGLENKLKATKSVLMKYIKYSGDFVHFQPISLLDSEKTERICLVIVVAQTKDEVPVEDVAGKYSYPSRLETGLERLDPRRISESKRGIYIDNYDFLLTLKKK